MKRSHEPVFWLLFGAGGMLCALTVSGLLLTTGLLGPMGVGALSRAFDYAHIRCLTGGFVGKGLVALLISLLLWHSVLRIGEALRDLAGIRSHVLEYGLRLLALAGTLTTVILLSI